MLEPLIHDLASQFLYDVARTTVVTFDDADSIGDKATYAHGAGLAGAFAWSLNQVRRTTACAHVLNLTQILQDYNYTLLNALRSGLGLS